MIRPPPVRSLSISLNNPDAHTQKHTQTHITCMTSPHSHTHQVTVCFHPSTCRLPSFMSSHHLITLTCGPGLCWRSLLPGGRGRGALPGARAPLSYLHELPCCFKTSFLHVCAESDRGNTDWGVKSQQNTHAGPFIFSPPVCNLDAGRHARWAGRKKQNKNRSNRSGRTLLYISETRQVCVVIFF